MGTVFIIATMTIGWKGGHLIELPILCAVVGALFWRFGLSPDTILYSIFSTCLLYISISDIKRRLIPTFFLIISTVLWIIFKVFLQKDYSTAAKNTCVAICYFVILLLLILVYKRIFGRKIMGMGDVKLIAVSALYVGAFPMLYSLLIACIAGVLFIMISKICKTKVDNFFPFGPFIAIGVYSVLLYG